MMGLYPEWPRSPRHSVRRDTCTGDAAWVDGIQFGAVAEYLNRRSRCQRRCGRGQPDNGCHSRSRRVAKVDAPGIRCDVGILPRVPPVAVSAVVPSDRMARDNELKPRIDGSHVEVAEKAAVVIAVISRASDQRDVSIGDEPGERICGLVEPARPIFGSVDAYHTDALLDTGRGHHIDCVTVDDVDDGPRVGFRGGCGSGPLLDRRRRNRGRSDTGTRRHVGRSIPILLGRHGLAHRSRVARTTCDDTGKQHDNRPESSNHGGQPFTARCHRAASTSRVLTNVNKCRRDTASDHRRSLRRG